MAAVLKHQRKTLSAHFSVSFTEIPCTSVLNAKVFLVGIAPGQAALLRPHPQVWAAQQRPAAGAAPGLALSRAG